MSVKKLKPVPSDLDIAQAAEVQPILEIAQSIGISEDDLILYGRYKCKVKLDAIKHGEKGKRFTQKLRNNPRVSFKVVSHKRSKGKLKLIISLFYGSSHFQDAFLISSKLLFRISLKWGPFSPNPL